jgi:hypothetical protein
MRNGRMEDRTYVGSLGQLALPDKPEDPEYGWIENISEHGARVVSRHRLRSGECVIITSRHPPFRSAVASVVYCQTLLAGLYAIGFESMKGGVLQLLEKRVGSEPTDILALGR